MIFTVVTIFVVGGVAIVSVFGLLTVMETYYEISVEIKLRREIIQQMIAEVDVEKLSDKRTMLTYLLENRPKEFKELYWKSDCKAAVLALRK